MLYFGAAPVGPGSESNFNMIDDRGWSPSGLPDPVDSTAPTPERLALEPGPPPSPQEHSEWVNNITKMVHDTAKINMWWRVLSAISGAACVYHGYKRHNESIGWALGWGAVGALVPVIGPVIAVAQGFGKPMKAK